MDDLWITWRRTRRAQRRTRGIAARAFIPPARGRWALALAAGMGLAFGLLCVPIGAWLAAGGMRPSLAVAVAVNALLPLTAIALGVWHPRPALAALGGVLTYAAFPVGWFLPQWPQFWQWSPSTAAMFAHPILVVGALASAGLAALAAWVVSPWRVVGLPPDPARCPGCGYARGELARCPECGAGRK